jgi:alkanesulfonate monooxygenase SsuD/methylene tetrahydromethanopterin reductase-like flavin-dependent oxidoreductase (luciferase family)
MNFLLAPTVEIGAEILRDVKGTARAEFGRDIQVWGMAAITQGETQKEAENYFKYYVDEVGDWTGAENMLNAFAPNSGSYSPDHRAETLRAMVAGYCAWPIVGSAERIAESLIEIANLGFDGLSLSWVNYDDGLARFNAEVMPLLEQAGVRQPVVPA